MNVFMSTIAAPRPALAKEGLYDKYIFPTMPTMGLSAKKTYAANPIKNAAIADGTNRYSQSKWVYFGELHDFYPYF